jgi:acyl-CoA hydrolase
LQNDEALKPQRHGEPAAIVEAILAQVGKRVVMALPLGLGKAISIADEMVRRAVDDPSISLTIITALTLEPPRGGSDLERRFVTPLNERVFAGYKTPDYAVRLRDGTLPENIEVREFFLQAGQWLKVPRAQQRYISANYTHAGRYVLDAGVNVVAQLVAPGDGASYSLSCNPDLTTDLLEARREGRADFLLVGETNADLPFMEGHAEVPAQAFAHVLERDDGQVSLFGPPNQPVSLEHYAIGFRIAALIPDGGTLQIGIGALGDAVCHALLLRHTRNDDFRRVLDALGVTGAREDSPFEEGLYGCSEMIADGFLALLEAGVVAREVDGKAIHAAFFLGSREFYARLREMPRERRRRIGMTSVTFVNQLYGEEDAKRSARRGGRFINSVMMTTLLGDAVSDALEDGRVVSGIGGQYNFVAQSFALPDARSILALNATRTRGGATQSNILWSYGHVSVPRHLRDMVVTEYGVADLRGRPDEDVIMAMLGVTDAAFVEDLARTAKEKGKLRGDWSPTEAMRENTPGRLRAAMAPLRNEGLLPDFPWGTEFNETERQLLPVLQRLRDASRSGLVRLLMRGFSGGAVPGEAEALERMGLSSATGLRQKVYASLVRGAVRQGTS